MSNMITTKLTVFNFSFWQKQYVTSGCTITRIGKQRSRKHIDDGSCKYSVSTQSVSTLAGRIKSVFRSKLLSKNKS